MFLLFYNFFKLHKYFNSFSPSIYYIEKRNFLMFFKTVKQKVINKIDLNKYSNTYNIIIKFLTLIINYTKKV